LTPGQSMPDYICCKVSNGRQRCWCCGIAPYNTQLSPDQAESTASCASSAPVMSASVITCHPRCGFRPPVAWRCEHAADTAALADAPTYASVSVA
jgi:hypothetical protein